MDMIVTRIPKMTSWDRNAWTLTDLLGRPLGRITKHLSGTFIIEPSGRGVELMVRVDRGPHASLNEALTAIEKCTHGACHLAPERR